MNTSSQRLESLIDRFPQERDSIERLRTLIEAELNSDGTSHVFSIRRLIDKIMPSSNFAFSEILTVLEEGGVLEKILRVESPFTKMGISDFHSLLDIPPVIHDPSQDIDLEVLSENVKLLYRVRNDKSGK